MESSFAEKREMIKEPFLKNSSKGGFRTVPFIIANGMLEKVANYGLTANMALYLMRHYHMEMTTASNIVFYWSAATNFMPVIGAIIADSYVGMIGFGSIVSVLGMTLLWLTTVLPGVRPPCHEYVNSCSSTTVPQLFLPCTSFAVIAIGAGGIRSSSLAFGADKLKNEGWYYFTYTFSILIALTCFVCIQDKMGWEFGFGVSVVLMVFLALWFFLGSPFYVKGKAK